MTRAGVYSSMDILWPNVRRIVIMFLVQWIFYGRMCVEIIRTSLIIFYCSIKLFLCIRTMAIIRANVKRPQNELVGFADLCSNRTQ